jgi:hypothetical protein
MAQVTPQQLKEIRKFCESRCRKIHDDDEMLAVVDDGRRVVLHVFPISALDETKHNWDNVSIPLIAGKDVVRVPDNKGCVTIKAKSRPGYASVGYAHASSNGIIESVWANNNLVNGRNCIDLFAVERHIVEAFVAYLQMLQKVGAKAPFVIVFALQGMENSVVPAAPADDIYEDHHGGRNGESEYMPLESFDIQSVAAAMRRGFNAMWVGFGFQGSPCYDASGRWKSRG